MALDPMMFRRFDRLLHISGTHALCILAEWRINETDLNDLKETITGGLIIKRDEGEKRRFKGWFIYDVRCKVLPYYESLPHPELVFKTC